VRETAWSDVRAVGWWVLVGAGAGAIAGVVVGGIGGRLAMLLLRLTSGDVVLGVESDDGFEIGVVSAQTLVLFAATAVMGTIDGVFYAALREGIPLRLRLPLWTLVGAALVGSVVVHEDGVDFTLLEPQALAVALFVALPAVASAMVFGLVERWSAAEPWSDRRLTAVLLVAAACGTVALAFAAVVGAGAVILRRLRLGEVVRRAGRIAVPSGIAVVTVVSGVELVRESIRIVD
jgi:hypothetical protein